MLYIVFSFLAVVALGALIILHTKYSYWKRRNVPHPPPLPILGNYKDYILLRKNLGETTKDICQKFPNEPYIGTYYGTEPALIVQDPDLIKLILTKEFFHFNGREVCAYTHRELTTRNLFFGYGDTWKAMRHSMTPLFTPVRMKNMYPLIQKCARDFEDLLARETVVTHDLDLITLMARYTMDCIGSVAFGVETDTMKDKKDNPFRAIGDVLFEISYRQQYASIIRSMWPAVFYGFGFTLFPKKMNEFFHRLLTDVFAQRGYKPSARNDFVDLILNLRNNDYIYCDNWKNLQGEEKIKLKVDDELLVSQCEVMFAAGYETSATTLSFTLYELAKDQRVLKKALEEVDGFMLKHGRNNQLEYENLTEFPYVEACIDETLRLYPVLATLTREVVHEYTLPTGLRLEEGTRLHIPVLQLHRSAALFPEPDRFRPERFLPHEKQNILPYTYLPFGEGPRICIGLRMGKMVTLTALVTLLKRYRVELADGMPPAVRFEPKALVTRPVGDITLKVVPRE